MYMITLKLPKKVNLITHYFYLCFSKLFLVPMSSDSAAQVASFILFHRKEVLQSFTSHLYSAAHQISMQVMKETPIRQISSGLNCTGIILDFHISMLTTSLR